MSCETLSVIVLTVSLSWYIGKDFVQLFSELTETRSKWRIAVYYSLLFGFLLYFGWVMQTTYLF